MAENVHRLDQSWGAVENTNSGADELLAFPLSFAQQRLWILDQLDENTSAYNIPIALRLRGQLSLEALNHAFTEILRRHEVLRARFEPDSEGPRQIIAPVQPVVLPVTDLSSLSEQERIWRAERLAKQEANQPFDLAQGTVIRMRLLKLAADDHVLLITVHHIAFDGWSQRILLRELQQLYESFVSGEPAGLPELPLQYTDFVVWQRQYLSGRRLEEQLKYWRERLGGAPPVLDLPTDRPRPPRQTYRGAKMSTMLPASLVEQMEQLSRREGVTFFMTLLAAFNVFLARYSGQDDIVVGSPIAGRNRVELENLIGFFVTTLALRTDLSGNPSFRQVLARVKENTLGAYAHQDTPFEKIVEELKPDRDLSRNPIFQVMLVLQNLPGEQGTASDLQITPFADSDKTSAKFDLVMTANRKPEGLRLTFEYSTDLFEAATIERMQEHLRILLEGIVAGPERRIWEFPLMSAHEREQVVVKWNQTGTNYDRNASLHSLFDQQAAATPDRVALLFEGRQMIYRELSKRANQLANYLIRKGVRPADMVGIALERSPEAVIAILAVLKAGAAYVPLDPAYPRQRLAFIVEDSKAWGVITDRKIKDKVPLGDSNVVLLDADAEAIGLESAQGPSVALPDNPLAYLVYTSGSTGIPKGVEGTHRASVNRLLWMWKAYPFQPGECLCQKTTLGFVDAVWEIFGPLAQGIPNVIIPQETVLDPEKLIRTLAENEVTRIVLVPSHIRTLLESGGDIRRRLPKLKIWSASGEAVPADLSQSFLKALPGTKLLNMYGSSETAADASWHEILPADQDPVPIGRPLDNSQVYLLDRYLNPVPVGVCGIIYVGGDCLAAGYWNRPELTAERFINNPFAPELSVRLYNTGDLGRFRPDGTIEYLGRSDHQVKVRGYRIELGEIESVLERHETVQQAAVVLREFAGEKRLVAYATAKPGKEISIRELRSHIEQTLPAYMMPAAFVVLDKFPLTTSGKISRLALPQPEQGANPAAVRPRDSVERKLAEIWQRVLGLTGVGVTENFFELGGHSLLAVRLVSEIKKETGQEIPLATLFQGATIEYLANIVRVGQKPAHQIVMAVQAEGSKPPFFGIVTPGVNPLGYVALARHLGEDQPLYQIQGPGARLRRPYTAQEFEQLASNYIQAMRKVHPHGPYYLGGMCEGARIAFDMARLLEAQGETVALLAILDTWVLENSQNRWLWKIDYYSGRIKSFWRGSRQDKWRDLRQWAENRYGPTRPERLWPKAYWPGKDFVPAKFSGKITVFKIPKQPFYYINDPTLGWRTRTLGEVELQLIDSKHLRLLREPYVRALAPKLRECLERARREATSQQEKAMAAAQNSVALVKGQELSRGAQTHLGYTD